MAARCQKRRDAWAIVPVKRLLAAKQRLSRVLSSSERAELATTMLLDVLTTLIATQDLAGVVVVTGDPTAARLARALGAIVVSDTVERGMNEAVIQGMEALDLSNSSAVIIPADVPFATVEEIGSIVRFLDVYFFVLASAPSDGGTNALAMRIPNSIIPRFGANSFLRHKELAKRVGPNCKELHCHGLGKDIDRPEDLVVPANFGDRNRTAALIKKLDLGKRLGVNELFIA
jgi:2-phospho-L-lactate guanylyltransferase